MQNNHLTIGRIEPFPAMKFTYLLIPGIRFIKNHHLYFSFISTLFLVTTSAIGATEDLDQMMLRKARQSTAVWNHNILENPSRYHYWQPESFVYQDISTGTEVWRISNTPGRLNLYHSDIGVSPWSANGKRLAFTSDRDTSAFKRAHLNPWMIVNTDGSKLRPIPNAPARVNSHTPFFHWTPNFEDKYFELGKKASYNETVMPNVLYKAIVNDTSVVSTPLVNLPTFKGVDLKLNKTVSATGSKSIVMTWDESWLFPITVYPDSSAKLDINDGYTVNRKMGGPDYHSTWGDTPSLSEGYSSHHDAYYPGDGTYLFLLPSGKHAWWKDKVLGSAPDGGSIYFFEKPAKFSEQIPVNTAKNWGGVPDPFGSNYWSHFVPDRWGRYALFSNSDASPIGPSVWDMESNKYVNFTFGGGAQHHDWSAFSDWNVSTSGPKASNYSNDRIYTQKYSSNGSQKTVCYTHALFNNEGKYNGASNEYSSLARPGQSPDGTKVAFHSTFLNQKTSVYDDKPDIYWAVAYYPYPPEIRSAIKNGNMVKLVWDFNQGTNTLPNRINPRTYTNRGWPNETNDRPSSPREIDKFRIWVSTDAKSWMPIATVSYNNCRGANECGTWTDTSWTYSAIQPNSTTRYYAITSVEFSGLESQTLSNIWAVTIDSDGTIANSTQIEPYPEEPGSKSHFYNLKPPQPTNVGFYHKLPPASENGQYTIEWIAPKENILIRFYNIYAIDAKIPKAVQQQRIASVPATADYIASGQYKYIDWLGNPDGTTQYAVTAVDFHGNESDVSIANLMNR